MTELTVAEGKVKFSLFIRRKVIFFLYKKVIFCENKIHKYSPGMLVMGNKCYDLRKGGRVTIL